MNNIDRAKEIRRLEIERNESYLARAVSRNLDETTPRSRRPAAVSPGWHRAAYIAAIILAAVIVALVVALGGSRMR